MAIEAQEILLTGTPICRGIAIGRPFIFSISEDAIPEFPVADEEIMSEIARYKRALAISKDHIRQLLDNLQEEKIIDGAAILDAHLQIIEDPLLTTHVEQLITTTKKNAEYVLQSLIKEYQKKFNTIKDPFFRERFKDIREISQRILGTLRQTARIRLKDVPTESIIFALDLTTFDTAEADSSQVAAFVTKSGGVTSHAAIVARGRGIPYVSNIDVSVIESMACDPLIIVDGRTGDIIINPFPDTLEKYKQLRDRLQIHLQKLKQIANLDAETFDGYKIQLSANIEMLNEIDMLHQHGGNGVGLLRTESALLLKEKFPTEDEQFTMYKHFVEKMKGLPIVIRTFDLGGDKYFLGQSIPQESNPFLGCRAIRFLLKEKDVFKSQLRAILRASNYGDVSVMFPMVSSLSELLEAKEILEEIRQELTANGEQIPTYLPVGCMIEVPSAAMIADLLAKECDFLSIGTNDLVQYLLAVDRDNHAISSLYTPAHPSVIRLIRLIVSEANYHGIPVAVCGEVAADPRFTPLLLGLGVNELSVASRYIPIIKNAIRSTSIVQASRLAEQALRLTSATEVEELLNQEYKNNVPEDCFYNC